MFLRVRRPVKPTSWVRFGCFSTVPPPDRRSLRIRVHDGPSTERAGWPCGRRGPARRKPLVGRAGRPLASKINISDTWEGREPKRRQVLCTQPGQTKVTGETWSPNRDSPGGYSALKAIDTPARGETYQRAGRGGSRLPHAVPGACALCG
ncbi:hypothetical protein LZ30DRAFT_427782 [Colletotrichum cereale]|nr:hypothetical protein LZ30DRAFT_427782 [Colletotrichum cereale]